MSLYGGIGSNFAFLKETGSVKKERKMTIELIFKIAAVGILVTILGQVLKHSGREEQAFLVSLAGLFIVLSWIIPCISELFTEIQPFSIIGEDRMLVFKIALIGIAGAMLAMVTKQFKPEYSTLVLLAVCLFLIRYLTSNLKEVLNFVQTLQKRIPISSMYIKILLKLLAIAYICQIASNLCEDLGYHSISFQIETIGKLSILVLSIPIISSLLETIEHLLT